LGTSLFSISSSLMGNPKRRWGERWGGTKVPSYNGGKSTGIRGPQVIFAGDTTAR
jgi:hypothetical protein